MSAELGIYCLILACIAALFLAVVPLIGLQLNRDKLIASARFYVIIQFVFIALS